MPKLIIDNRPIEVPEGTKVIDAAEKLGIMIPRFCYHPALGSAGACRMCAVKFLEGPVKGVQMSCMVDAKDGMVVSTTEEEAVDFRRHMIEWLMLNHPHDCPVCDEGGHCLLQDLTISGGHGRRRYKGNKRTHHDQYLGPLVQHEMNRCIHCYRCVRFYQEFCGYYDFGTMQIGDRVYFGRYQEGMLENPFSGNLIDICPTGVFTDKPSRFSGRRWDYERTPSVCIHCSLGCHTTVNVRYRRLIRLEARFSSNVNGHFICDRGRYGFYYGDRADRLRENRVHGNMASGEEALAKVVQALEGIEQKFGSAAIACIGSTRSSIETLSMIKQLCMKNGWTAPAFWTTASQAAKSCSAVSRLEPRLAVSLQEIETADFILALGADPVNEAPMLALALHQAQRRGARIVVVDPRPIRLPFEFTHLPESPAAIDDFLGGLLKGSVGRDIAAGLSAKAAAFYDSLPAHDLSRQAVIEELATVLQQSHRPVIVCGTEMVTETLPAFAADSALLLQDAGKKAGLFYVLPGANAFGAAMLSENAGSLEEIIARIENGYIKAVLVIESDPLGQFPDRQRLEHALEQLDLLVVMDYLNSASARRADIFIATATVFESGGIFINQEGRAQQILPAYSGGPSIEQIGGGGHPPRSFPEEIPGGTVVPAGAALAAITRKAAPQDEPFHLHACLQDTHPLFAGLPTLDSFPADGIRLLEEKNSAPAFQTVSTDSADIYRSCDGVLLLLTEQTFGTEELSADSPPLKPLVPAPQAFLHSADAIRLGLTNGGDMIIQTSQGLIQVQLSVQDQMAAGVLILPRYRQLAWQIFTANQKTLGIDQIRAAKDIVP